ncbi:hypothetical protein ACFW04_013641 [Cataglyphis niger]
MKKFLKDDWFAIPKIIQLFVLLAKLLTCHKASLIKHSQSIRPVKKINIQIKRAKIKLSNFLAEHNIGFQLIDHLFSLLKNINLEPESYKIIQSLSLSTKSKRKIEELKILQTHKFSILIDENTDITDTKLLCLLVQYLSPTDKKIKTKLLELISLDATDCTANKLFEKFKTILETKQIPLRNIVGMTSDNAFVMIGYNNSFFSHLKSEIPGLILINCIILPQSCEHLIRGVATYTSGSAKRCAILGKFQDFFNVVRHKILKLSNTIWLVLHKCVTSWRLHDSFLPQSCGNRLLVIKKMNHVINKAFYATRFVNF